MYKLLDYLMYCLGPKPGSIVTRRNTVFLLASAIWSNSNFLNNTDFWTKTDKERESERSLQSQVQEFRPPPLTLFKNKIVQQLKDKSLEI